MGNQGKYVRTPELRLRQSEVQKEISKNRDYPTIVAKRKQTIENGEIKLGRKPVQELTEIKCVLCDKTWINYATHSQRKFCSRICYANSRKGKRWLTTEQLKSVDRSYPRPNARKSNTNEFKRFKNLVHRLSQKVYEHNISIINPNNYPRTLNGIDGGYQLDHKISISEGYRLGMTAEELSAIDNLQMLPWLMNVKKGGQSGETGRH